MKLAWAGAGPEDALSDGNDNGSECLLLSPSASTGGCGAAGAVDGFGNDVAADEAGAGEDGGMVGVGSSLIASNH